MKLVIVSTFWNAEKLVSKCIESLKNQYYTNFVAYFVDDMSTDNSFDVAKKTIGGDDRFILIKNEEKKYKTKLYSIAQKYHTGYRKCPVFYSGYVTQERIDEIKGYMELR